MYLGITINLGSEDCIGVSYIILIMRISYYFQYLPNNAKLPAPLPSQMTTPTENYTRPTSRLHRQPHL